MNKIVLSGSTGFLGQTLKPALEQKGWSVNGLNRHRNGQTSRFDLRFPFEFPHDFDSDIIIHAAGKAHCLPKTVAEKQEFYDINVGGTKHLCSALERLGRLPKSFIFISTVAVYGVDKGENISEDHPLNGNTPYAESKLLAEDWLSRWTAENNVTLAILRLPLIAGVNPVGNLKSMIDGIAKGRYLSIGKAEVRKSMVWAEDIASIVPRLAVKGGTYNLTDGFHPSLRELEVTIANALNKRNPIKVPYWFAKGLAYAGDMIGPRFPINSEKLQKVTSTLTFDDNKARQKLDWEPTPVLSRIEKIV